MHIIPPSEADLAAVVLRSDEGSSYARCSLKEAVAETNLLNQVWRQSFAFSTTWRWKFRRGWDQSSPQTPYSSPSYSTSRCLRPLHCSRHLYTTTKVVTNDVQDAPNDERPYLGLIHVQDAGTLDFPAHIHDRAHQLDGWMESDSSGDHVQSATTAVSTPSLPQSENSGLISQTEIGNMNSWPADPYFS
jgi:hypothetical protein